MKTHGGLRARSMVGHALALITLAACRPAPPVATVPPATATAAATGDPAPAKTTESPSPTVAPAPAPRPAVHRETGWVRDPDDPASPVLQLTRLYHHGPSANAIVTEVLGHVDALLACGTSAVGDEVRRLSFQIRVRHPDSPDEDPLRIDVQPAEADAVARCVDEALRDQISAPADGEVAGLSFRVFADAQSVSLRRADESRVVAVRAAGTCWQWETYPCAPHKHCKAAEFIRTTCGEPAMRDDAVPSFALGPPDARGNAAPTEIRLVSGDGQVAWRTTLPASTQQRYGRRFVAADAPIEIRARVTAFDVRLGVDNLIVADAAGVHVFARRTGELVTQWVAPPRGQPAMQFDGGNAQVRRRRETCQTDAGHGRFFAACEDRWVWFDGHTMAVFGGAVPKHLATKTVGESGSKLGGDALTPTLKVKAAGVTVQVSGQIFVQ